MIVLTLAVLSNCVAKPSPQAPPEIINQIQIWAGESS